MIPSPDGKYWVVFLADELGSWESEDPVERQEVQKEMDRLQLPGGRVVDSRREFIVSGLYRPGDDVPLIQLSVNGTRTRPRVVWSDDSRHFVLLNLYRLGHRAENWAIKFCSVERGLIREIPGSRIIQFPGLLPLRDYNWYYDWMRNYADPPAIVNSTLSFQTTTHDWFTFDIRTGVILYEFRMWRQIRRAAIGLGMLVVGLIVWKLKRSRRAKTQFPERLHQEPLIPRQFSLRSLLVLMGVVAVVSGLWRISWAPPVLVLCWIAVIAAFIFGRRVVRAGMVQARPVRRQLRSRNRTDLDRYLCCNCVSFG